MRFQLNSNIVVLLFLTILFSSCKKDSNPDPVQPSFIGLVETKLNASITGAFTDTINISYDPELASFDTLLATFFVFQGSLGFGIVDYEFNGHKKMIVVCEEFSPQTGTYTIDLYQAGDSYYYNSIIGTPTMSCSVGELEILKINEISAGSKNEYKKYISGNFYMIMYHNNDTVNVNATFENVVLGNIHF